MPSRRRDPPFCSVRPIVHYPQSTAEGLFGRPRQSFLGRFGRLVDRARGYVVRELGHGRHDPAPGCRPVVIAGKREFVSSIGAFLSRLLAVAFEHQLHCPPKVDLGYHPGKAARSSSIKV
jgi:hypothetical protein